jgi:O-antigen ligase
MAPRWAPSVPVQQAQAAPHPAATRLLLIYVFLMMSRGTELLSIVINANLRLTMILVIVCLVTALYTGGLWESVRTPLVLIFTGLTCWLMFATLASQWKGGSVAVLTGSWFVSFACVVLVPASISNLEQCRKAFYAIAFSLIPILLATFFLQSQVEGRDVAVQGTLANPNDLAFYLLLLIPFAVFLIKNERLFHWKTILCAAAIVIALIKTLRTGSRTGLLALAICFVILFFTGKLKSKIKLLVAAALVAVIAITFVPSTLLLRYATVFNGVSSDAAMSSDEMSAVESSRARKMLFEESVRIMLEHPFLGVGPGIFSAALAGEQQARGQSQTWHEAHNSFTQLGSEAGFPALLLYLAAVIYSLKRTISIYRLTRRDPNRVMIRQMAGTLVMALLIFIVCGAFGTYSYTFHLPLLAGLVQAFDVCVRRELKTPVPAPAPAIVRAPLQARAPIAAPIPQVPNYVRNRRIPHNRV